MSVSDFGGILLVLSFILMPGGATLIGLSYFLYRVPVGHALISKRAERGRVTEGKWTISLNLSRSLVSLNKETLNFPTNAEHVELLTPDEGVLGIKVSVTYSPDSSSGIALNTYAAAVKNLPKILEARTQSALNSWVKNKPLPGTLKRALAMKDEAENFVRAKITSIPPSDALTIHNDPMLYYHGGYPVNDLGVCIHEVHITEMQSLKRGMGRADWGDGTESVFNADRIFNQFKAKAHNLHELDQVYEELKNNYPNQEENIKDIYYDFQIRLKEDR